MKRLLLSLLCLLAGISGYAQQAEVKSPDGLLVVNVETKGGKAYYRVSRNGATALQPSRLGLKADFGDFSEQLTLVSTEVLPIKQHYTLTHAKTSAVDYEANQLLVTFKNGQEQTFGVEFRVSNSDVALRYHLYRQQEDNPKSAVVTQEVTSFRLPDGTTTFLSPQSGPMVGWERTKPSYEEVYSADAPMNARSQFGQGYVFPALFHIGSSPSALPFPASTLWVLISETGVSSQYCGSHLSDFDATDGYTIAYPMPGENNGNGTHTAGIALPGTTPWRTITVGETLKPIVETTVSYDLVEPLYEPSQVYAPGRYTWSWLIGQDESINYDDQVRFIDLASAMGFEYCLVDNWWDQRIGRERMAELSRYAQSKGVSLMLWYNSNGYENDAPQTPRQCMNTAIARDREMKWLKSIGVKGIKVDFFGGDKQVTMQLYEDILADANRYGLQVIFHGCTLPRGWERMYPNYVASEAVLASENLMFGEEATFREAFDLTLHPFCRNSVAAMDWGGIIMNHHMATDNRSRHTRKTTDIFELASGIIMQTAIQCVAIQPNNLSELPQFELDFLKALPTTWDETQFIEGYPGRYIVLARRHGDQWYVAGLNATSEPLRLSLQLNRYFHMDEVNYYVDSRDRVPQLKKIFAARSGLTNITIQPNGGVVLVK